MIQQKIYFSQATYKIMYEDGYLGTANIVFEKSLDKEEIFNIGKQSDFYIVDEDLKQRIDKAIEYIENNDLYELEYNEDIYENTENLWGANDEIARNDLLDILKGCDSNDNK